MYRVAVDAFKFVNWAVDADDRIAHWAVGQLMRMIESPSLTLLHPPPAIHFPLGWPLHLQVLCIVCVLAAGATIYWSSFPWMFPLLIALGGLATLAWNWKKDMSLKVGP